MAYLPHLQIPFTPTSGGNGPAATVPQDSIEDVAQCVTVLCATPTGSRVDLPAYGTPDQTFAQYVNPAAVVQAAATWEPRAAVTATATPGPDAALTVNVSLASGQ